MSQTREPPTPTAPRGQLRRGPPTLVATMHSVASRRPKRLRRSPGPEGSLPSSPASSLGSSNSSSPTSKQLDQLTCSCGLEDPDNNNNNNNDTSDCNNNNNNNSYEDKPPTRRRIDTTPKTRRGATSAVGATVRTCGKMTITSKESTDQHTPQPATMTAPFQPGRLVIQTLGLGTPSTGGLASARSRNICQKHMPWFGIDVGGSLVKVVFFDPREAAPEELATLQRIRQYLWSSKAYGATGTRDAHLEMANCLINGRAGSLHFLRFATSEMPEFLTLARRKGFAESAANRTICATGGGACKFEHEIRHRLGIRLHKTDEFDSIIHGIPYIDRFNSNRECYFLSEPLDEQKCAKVPYDFRQPYPYLVVNIGSGVSILAVYSRERYSRISGSSLGGGTFLGLCCLLTQCNSFDEAIELAQAGSSTRVDKLVKDIYGGDYAKFELSGDTVASAFGHMNLASRRKQVKREDLARALLEMVTNNIGSLARMCAVNHGIDRVVFIGNFLRANQLSMRLLSFAVNYWSKGSIKALFLEHEGYFGAVGCFVESTQGCQAAQHQQEHQDAGCT